MTTTRGVPSEASTAALPGTRLANKLPWTAGGVGRLLVTNPSDVADMTVISCFLHPRAGTSPERCEARTVV